MRRHRSLALLFAVLFLALAPLLPAQSVDGGTGAAARCAFSRTAAKEIACLEAIRDSLDLRLVALERRFAEARRDSAAIPGGWRLTTASTTSPAPSVLTASRIRAARRVLVVGAVVAGRVDRDAGGYPEPWNARATWTGQDKQAHAGLGFGLGAVFGARATCAAGAGFELAQSIGGKGSVPDALVTCAGGMVGALARKVWR